MNVYVKGNGLTIISGCDHEGVVNTAPYAKEIKILKVVRQL
jgi:metal-dependent hydrolase (beta-lactamase superfamily II)